MDCSFDVSDFWDKNKCGPKIFLNGNNLKKKEYGFSTV